MGANLGDLYKTIVQSCVVGKIVHANTFRAAEHAMLYKLYRYTLETDKDIEIHPDKHFKLFDTSKWKDDTGQFALYRGKKDAVLMHIRNYDYDFIGLVGRHSTEREVTDYDPREDVTRQIDIDDDDYPHTPFLCFPRIRMIACIDGAKIKADTAMSRLHSILLHRKKAWFTFTPVTESFDLRKAVNRFRLIDVTFEIFPVNPHSEDLGKQLDESKKLDHIKKLNGSAHGSVTDPLQLEGGFLTAVQQLQKSGHAKVGFKAFTEDKKIEIDVPKPSKVRELTSDPEDTAFGENVGVRIRISERHTYPFERSHVKQIRSIARTFTRMQLENENE